VTKPTVTVKARKYPLDLTFLDLQPVAAEPIHQLATGIPLYMVVLQSKFLYS